MKKYIVRTIESRIVEKLFKGRILIIYGPRRSGKTTLAKNIIAKHSGVYFNCEDPILQNAFEDNASAFSLRQFLGNGTIFVLDEAQSIPNIGGLWENFCILERKKIVENNNLRFQQYFWRTYEGKEIDLVEIRDQQYKIYECKYTKSDVKFPNQWFSNYPETTSEVISRSTVINLLKM